MLYVGSDAVQRAYIGGTLLYSVSSETDSLLTALVSSRAFAAARPAVSADVSPRAFADTGVTASAEPGPLAPAVVVSSMEAFTLWGDYAEAVLADAPTVYYRGDKESYYLKDSSGNNRPGPITSPGIEGPGLDGPGFWTGTDSHLFPANHGGWDDELTIELWVRYPSPHTFVEPWETYLIQVGTDGVDYETSLIVNPTTGALELWNGVPQSPSSWNTWSGAVGGTVVRDNEWHHVVFALKAGDPMRLYVDGELEAVGPQGWEPSTVGDQRIVFGSTHALVDEFAMYDKVLVPQRIAAHHRSAPRDTYTPIIQADDPILYWKFDPPSLDRSGNDLHATIDSIPNATNKGYVTGLVEAAYKDPGSGNMRTAYDPVLSPAANPDGLTIEFWHKQGGYNGQDKPAGSIDAAAYVAASMDPTNKGFVISRGSDGHVRAYVGANYELVRGITPVNDDQWHHIAVSMPAASGSEPDKRVKIYVDGVLDGAATTGFDGIIGAPALYLGRNVQGGGIGGLYDEFAVHSGALSAARIFERVRDRRVPTKMPRGYRSGPAMTTTVTSYGGAQTTNFWLATDAVIHAVDWNLYFPTAGSEVHRFELWIDGVRRNPTGIDATYYGLQAGASDSGWHRIGLDTPLALTAGFHTISLKRIMGPSGWYYAANQAGWFDGWLAYGQWNEAAPGETVGMRLYAEVDPAATRLLATPPPGGVTTTGRTALTWDQTFTRDRVIKAVVVASGQAGDLYRDGVKIGSTWSYAATATARSYAPNNGVVVFLTQPTVFEAGVTYEMQFRRSSGLITGQFFTAGAAPYADDDMIVGPWQELAASGTASPLPMVAFVAGEPA